MPPYAEPVAATHGHKTEPLTTRGDGTRLRGLAAQASGAALPGRPGRPARALVDALGEPGHFLARLCASTPSGMRDGVVVAGGCFGGVGGAARRWAVPRMRLTALQWGANDGQGAFARLGDADGPLTVDDLSLRRLQVRGRIERPRRGAPVPELTGANHGGRWDGGRRPRACPRWSSVASFWRRWPASLACLACAASSRPLSQPCGRPRPCRPPRRRTPSGPLIDVLCVPSDPFVPVRSC